MNDPASNNNERRPVVPSRRRRGPVWPWLIGIAVLAGGALWWWKSNSAASGPAGADAARPGASATAGGGAGGGRRFAAANRVQPVSVQKVERRDLHVNVNAIGSIAASNTAIVRAQVSGVLQTLAFKEGQQVKAGQLLAQIDPRSFQASLAQAEGALARDKAQLDNARVDLTRYRDLLAKDAIPKQQLDTQEALVRQLEGTVRVDQAAVATARLQLSYTRVTAPISGRVGLKQVDLGNIVQPGDANGIVTITQTQPIALTFAIPSVNVPQVTAKLHAPDGMAVEAWDRGGTKRLAVGKLATLDNAIDPSTDTIKLKALFGNSDEMLFPNQAVSVRLRLDTLAGALAVPPAAVLRGAQGFYVYVVDADSVVSTRTVQPGAVDGDWMAVDGKLQEGETIVIDGVDRLREGAKVEVIAADPKLRAGAQAASAPRRGGRGASGPSGAATGASGAASAADSPAWMSRLPPELVEKVKAMGPDERREFLQKLRERRQAGSAATAAN